jgi:tetratricopeptide (TPR) repeat protein
LTDLERNNLNPQQFVFWLPPEGHMIHVGPEQQPVVVPQVPLPIKIADLEALGGTEDLPGDNAIGEGVYDYLRQLYSHFLADLAAHVVMLDKKEVDPAYVFRKLTYLKILRLLEPGNAGLVWQLAHGFYALALTFTELPQVRRNLLDAMRFGQNLLKLKPEDPAALSLLADIDILFGDYPTAMNRLRKLLDLLTDEATITKVKARLEKCVEIGFPNHPLMDDLECIGHAMQLYSAEDYTLATELLERLEEDAYFMSELKSADFLCLLGMCRLKMKDSSGAFDALSQALEMDPEHDQARVVLESV